MKQTITQFKFTIPWSPILVIITYLVVLSNFKQPDICLLEHQLAMYSKAKKNTVKTGLVYQSIIVTCEIILQNNFIGYLDSLV